VVDATDYRPKGLILQNVTECENSIQRLRELLLSAWLSQILVAGSKSPIDYLRIRLSGKRDANHVGDSVAVPESADWGHPLRAFACR
jgi:hypothetical protein